jgi:hypothetical protein
MNLGSLPSGNSIGTNVEKSSTLLDGLSAEILLECGANPDTEYSLVSIHFFEAEIAT